MTTFHLKLIAVMAMVVDHVGLFFLPEARLLRIVGRISFPLFAWLIANGARETKSINKYLYRLLLAASVSQVPFFVANRMVYREFTGLNVIFTLFLGLSAIAIIRNVKGKLLWVPVTLILAFFGNLLGVEYGAAGVVSIVVFYVFFDRLLLLFTLQSLIFCWEIIYMLFLLTPNHVWNIVTQTNYLRPWALLSLFLLPFYNGKPGIRAKSFFYIFYPLQYVIVILIKRLPI